MRARIAWMACITLLLTRSARAEEPTSTSTSTAMHDYFHGEKAQGWAWSGVGFVAVSSGTALFAMNDSLTRAAAYPIFIVGAIQLGAGIASFLRPERTIAANDARIAVDPSGFLEDEKKRIHRVNNAFIGLELFEAAMMTTGIALASAGYLDHDDTLKGVGIGLGIQGLAMFALDAAAHERAERYENLLLGLTATPKEQGLSLGVAF